MKTILVLTITCLLLTPAFASSGRSRDIGMKALLLECAQKNGVELDPVNLRPRGSPDAIKQYRACLGL